MLQFKVIEESKESRNLHAVNKNQVFINQIVRTNLQNHNW